MVAAAAAALPPARRLSRQAADAVVVGAGVIGLAVARALAASGHEVIVVEAEAAIAQHTSSRNSEVIHAGIYYPTGSLKARSCVRGRGLLQAYLDERGLPYRRIGKLVVATADTEVEALRRSFELGLSNGVADLQWLSPAEIGELEPAIAGVAGFLSPSTGILDSHAYLLSLQGDAERSGAVIALNSPVRGGRIVGDGIELEIGGADPMRLRCRLLVNCGGLGATALARSIAGFPAEHIPRTYLCKGHYFEYRRASPFSRLVYPKAGGGGLGIHVTLDLAGRARFGPDAAIWPGKVDYAFDPSRRADFLAAIRRYFPALQDADLSPAYTGIRPKLVGPGEPDADFVISCPLDHGVPGVVNFFGIESPGLTASLALAEEMMQRLAG